MKKSRKSEDVSLNVICPVCSAWKNKPCVHTKGARKGKRREESHSDRTRLARVKLSSSAKEKLDKADREVKKEDRRSARAKSRNEKASKAKERLTDEQQEVVDVINEKIEVLGKHAQFVGPVSVGPIISTYRYLPLARTKVAHLESIHKDVAVALGAEAVLIKRMPGESAVGFFIPNKERQIVQFRDTLSHAVEFMQDARDHSEDKNWHLPIPVNFGITADGEPYVDDLTSLPHLLIAGTTGGGKSTLLHAVVDTVCWTMSPDEIKLIISDTKGVEFKHFDALPHLWHPIATNLYHTMNYLQNAIDETQDRLDKFGMQGVRNIHEYNERQPAEKKMPYIIIVIDELADLMGPSLERSEAKMNSDKLSTVVARSRASGIYCIAATQRPDVKQIKGSIKANFPARLSFRLPSLADSKTIINTKGAEGLMMKGDMLYMSSTSPELKRLHAPYMTLEESKDMITMIVKRHAVEETMENVLGKVGTEQKASVN
jgi:S-DNA-T family DNA segregation ATPase FtsK/SpoIIIE